MNEVVLAPLARQLAWALVHFLWQGALLGLMAWGTFVLVRRQRPQVRYGVACFFLLACLIVPVVTLFMQRGVPIWQDPQATQAVTYRLILGMRQALLAWLPAILTLWGVGAGWFALRALGSWFWLHRLRVSAAAVLDNQQHSALGRLRKSLGISRSVNLLESARVHSPFTTGLIRPVILVPLGFFTSIDPLAAEAVLAHELAHIRRLDVVVIGLQTVIETLLFYHPVTWWISRRVATEREHCCDDAAVQACGDAVLFAQTLHRLEALREAIPALAPGAGGGDLMERIKRLLKIEPAPVRLTAPLLSMTVALATTVLLAGQQPVRDLVRTLPERIASVGDYWQGGDQEIKGALLAVEESITEAPKSAQISAQAPDADPLRALPNPSTTTSAEAMILPNQTPIDPSSLQKISEEATSQAKRMVEATRLGIEFSNVGETVIVQWPEGKSFIEAEALPSQNLELNDIFGRPDLPGPYSYTNWPIISDYTRHLVSLVVPARSRATLSVKGNSNTPKDAFFYFQLFQLRSLASEESIWVSEKPMNKGAVANLSNDAKRFVILLAGPSRTPYRTEVTFAPLGEERPLARNPGAYPIKTWPLGETFVEEPSRASGEDQPRPVLVSKYLQRDSNTAMEWKAGFYSSPNRFNERESLQFGEDRVTRLRCWELELQPGERLQFQSSRSSQLQMEAAILHPSGIDERWFGAVQQANATDSIKRTKQLEIHNPTEKIQQLLLVAYQTQFLSGPFRINLKRSIDRKPENQ